MSSPGELKGSGLIFTKQSLILWVLRANSKDRALYSSQSPGPKVASKASWGQKEGVSFEFARANSKDKACLGHFFGNPAQTTTHKCPKNGQKQTDNSRTIGLDRRIWGFFAPLIRFGVFLTPKTNKPRTQRIGGFFCVLTKSAFFKKKNTKFWAKNGNLKTRELKGSGCFLPWFFGRARPFWLKNGPKMAIKSWFWY